jgi:small multidrug resistance family-3 protein
VAAQVINFFAFGVRPDLSVLLGGLLIVSGGLLMTFWH